MGQTQLAIPFVQEFYPDDIVTYKPFNEFQMMRVQRVTYGRTGRIIYHLARLDSPFVSITTTGKEIKESFWYEDCSYVVYRDFERVLTGLTKSEAEVLAKSYKTLGHDAEIVSEHTPMRF